MTGKKTWTTAQVRLFAIMTERVMPKLATISIEKPGERKLEDLSVEELEALALGKKKEGAVDAIVTMADEAERVAERTEKRETHMAITRGLAHVVGVDDAEKKYIARKATRYSLREMEQQWMKQANKPQPAPTAQQLENLRKGRGKNMLDAWRAQGLTEDEVQEREKQRIENLKATVARGKAARERRLGLALGLGDAQDLPKVIAERKNEILKEFRLPSRRGVRTQSSLLKEKQKQDAAQARKLEKRNNPTVYNLKAKGLSEEQQKRIGLRELRQLRPDIFEMEKTTARELAKRGLRPPVQEACDNYKNFKGKAKNPKKAKP